jgi:NAD(P)-dependent dehydrogenase (short-subunit alcohol dehydrogenase family)
MTGENSTSQNLAVIVGASGGIGAALSDLIELDGTHSRVVRLARDSEPPIDIVREESVAAAARFLAEQPGDIRLVVVATGFLHGSGHMPERSLRQIDPVHMMKAFEINAIGPALLMQHLMPLLPREGRSVFAVLSAKVGSIGDNRLGGWYGYRASKAALNQLVRTASIELRRMKPDAICVALHPGTTSTGLSAPFAKAGLETRPAAEAADQLLQVIRELTIEDTGSFHDYRGNALPW